MAIDYKALENLSEGVNDEKNIWLTDLIKIFLDQAKNKFQLLHNALLKNDLESIHKIAHLLKSSSAYLGAKRMQAICSTMEYCEGIKHAQELIAELNKEFDQCKGELENYLTNLEKTTLQ